MKVKISKQQRDYIYAKYENKCVNCGETEELSIDHIRPLSEGGVNIIENMQLMCVSCNRRKGYFENLPFVGRVKKIFSLPEQFATFKNTINGIVTTRNANLTKETARLSEIVSVLNGQVKAFQSAKDRYAESSKLLNEEIALLKENIQALREKLETKPKKVTKKPVKKVPKKTKKVTKLKD